ncbi:outer membrane lipoprotein-sorting protein [bacterium]|nr:outer membrane lipoprotein-sorting protein [bacterium]
MNRISIHILLLALIVTSGLPTFAQDSPDPHRIMMNVYERDQGDDMTSNLTMTLVNSQGEERVRAIRQFQRDFGDVEKKIMFFLAPADVENTSFMNWSYDDASKDDDQWIYLPALRKVKRISSDSKSDSFMGSDFTYDDLGDRHPDEDTHTLLREETLDGEPVYVIESTPKESDYMYSRTVSWVIKDKWIGLKKEFYDEDGDHLKTLNVAEYEQIDGFWIILDSEMHNVQADHRTRMKLKDVELDTGVDSGMFTERMMKRGM